MSYLLDHSVLFNGWTNLIYALALVVVLYFFITRMKAMKQEEQQLEKQISEKFSGEALEKDDIPAGFEFLDDSAEKQENG